jgi:hypothetical protein
MPKDRSVVVVVQRPLREGRSVVLQLDWLVELQLL